LKKLTGKDVQINIFEIKRPELDARLVADGICRQIEGRISYRRATKMSIASAMRMGAEGIKVTIAGRVNGAEIARSEKFKDGRTPLHTFRADIDYFLSEAHTTYGRIGIKVWIMKGEVFGKRDLSNVLGVTKRAGVGAGTGANPSAGAPSGGSDRGGSRDRDRRKPNTGGRPNSNNNNNRKA
jgi:small subunit ribosomal protein S3